MQIDFHIGGYAIRLQERGDHPRLHWPLQPFDSFLVQPERSPDIDLEVRVVHDLPEVPRGPLLFDANHGLWKLYAAESGFVLESPDTLTLQPRSRAMVAADFSHAEVWYREDRGRAGPGWTPMHVITPLLEVCLLTRLAREGGLLLHASGVLTDHVGLVFTGPSGAGKSTLADLFAARGACVLCDERMIIREVAGELVACGTPWVGSGRHATNAAGPLAALYCIRHGEGVHALRRMASRDFNLSVLQQCFLPHWDRVAMERTLEFLDELIAQVGSFELAFANNTDIVDYLEAQHLERSVASA
jgi:hypothetical protein